MTLFCNPSRILNELDEGQTKHWEQSLLKLIELEPGVVFNIMKDPVQGAVWDGSPHWCSRGHCLEIATYIERLCCNMLTDKCTSLRLVRCVLLQYIRMLFQSEGLISHLLWRPTSHLLTVVKLHLFSVVTSKLFCDQTFFYPNILHPNLPLQQTHHYSIIYTVKH